MQSVSLWCDYLRFVQEYDPSVREFTLDGIAKARNLFERAITAAGLHVTEGSKIWEAYREFEQAILHTIDETNIKVSVCVCVCVYWNFFEKKSAQRGFILLINLLIPSYWFVVMVMMHALVFLYIS